MGEKNDAKNKHQLWRKWKKTQLHSTSAVAATANVQQNFIIINYPIWVTDTSVRVVVNTLPQRVNETNWKVCRAAEERNEKRVTCKIKSLIITGGKWVTQVDWMECLYRYANQMGYFDVENNWFVIDSCNEIFGAYVPHWLSISIAIYMSVGHLLLISKKMNLHTEHWTPRQTKCLSCVSIFFVHFLQNIVGKSQSQVKKKCTKTKYTKCM